MQEEDLSNLPEETLCVLDRKTSSKRIEEIILKFKKLDYLNISLSKT